DHIGIGVARTRDQFSGPVFRIEVTPDVAHALVVPLDAAVLIFVLQLNAVEHAALKSEKRSFQSWMDEAFDRPDVFVFFFVARNDARLRAIEHAFDARLRIVPTKSKRRQ